MADFEHRDDLSEREIAERMGRALRRALKTPPKPHRPPKAKERPASKGRVRKGRSRV